MRLLKPDGVYAMVGGRVGLILASAAYSSVVAPLLGKRSGIVVFRPDGAHLSEISGLAVRGVVRPSIERVYPLSAGVEAMRHFSQGRALGKIVIAPASDGH